ncbi:hypothetical protein J2W28_000998 [Variovorax boronicumulans]|uniref:class I SAM-dependent methyltransferase n=1 Tax=Variovorax boronicumulans TaxID=436515 RepID=UPI00278118C6|nr:class I SAM-dependent methyltransferase [Variovorax boronicumulans]MDP9991970.1 hypothetical protein [Variovorax boronicumulans]MDQ0001865.1 hypothetical protein [Variovorax boronicumulans]
MLTTFSGRKASQNENELSGLIHMFKVEQVRSYLEIGAREGDTFYDIVSSLPVGSSALAVDLPGGMWGKSTTGRKLERAAAALRAKGYTVGVVLGDSTADKVIAAVRTCGPFEAALIDGDHRYAGAKADWENYGPMARLVAFHDIVGQGQREKVHGNEVEVPRLWSEIKATGAHWVEFVDEGSLMGIGVCVSR